MADGRPGSWVSRRKNIDAVAGGGSEKAADVRHGWLDRLTLRRVQGNTNLHEELLQTCGGDDDDQAAGLISGILESVRDVALSENGLPSGGEDRLSRDGEGEFAFDDIKDLVLAVMPIDER